MSPPLAPAPACYFLCSQTSGHWWGGTRLRGPASRVLTGIPATSVRLTSYSGNWSVAETPSGRTRRPVSSAPAALSSSGRSPAGTKPDRKAAAVSERLCPSTKKQSIDNPHQVWWWLAVATQVIRANFCSTNVLVLHFDDSVYNYMLPYNTQRRTILPSGVGSENPNMATIGHFGPLLDHGSIKSQSKLN